MWLQGQNIHKPAGSSPRFATMLVLHYSVAANTANKRKKERNKLFAASKAWVIAVSVPVMPGRRFKHILKYTAVLRKQIFVFSWMQRNPRLTKTKGISDPFIAMKLVFSHERSCAYTSLCFHIGSELHLIKLHHEIEN